MIVIIARLLRAPLWPLTSPSPYPKLPSPYTGLTTEVMALLGAQESSAYLRLLPIFC